MTLLPEQRLEFRQQGYVVIDSGIPAATLDALVDELRPYFGAERTDAPGAAMSSENRIQDFWPTSPRVHALATAPKVLSALRELYDREPKPFQTLNFWKGTEQAVHSDSIHFNSEPAGLMCGVWIALEDIGPDQGPLVYYPGSQDLPEMDFADFGLPIGYEHYGRYEQALAEFIEQRRLQPAFGEIRKGQALIWSATTLHGGSPQLDRDLTRWSQVTHYYFAGARPWRPGYSADGRAYFEPRWIPPVWSSPPPPLRPNRLAPVRRVAGRIARRLHLR
jgi:hypothetical protein